MKAMIFAAGFGKRLLPLTANIPKALVTIKGRPVLDWIIVSLINSGVDEIVINTHYLADKIESFILGEKYQVPITLVHEEIILGTGGGLYNTRHLWGQEDIFICNADILCDVNLKNFYQYHQKMNSSVTLAVNDIQSSAMLLVDDKSNLCGWHRNGRDSLYAKPEGTISKKGFCGLQLFNPSLFARMQNPPFESIIEQYMAWISSGFELKTWSIKDSYWIDVGTPASLEQARQTFRGYCYSPS